MPTRKLFRAAANPTMPTTARRKRLIGSGFTALLWLACGCNAVGAKTPATEAEQPVVGPDINAYYHGADHNHWRRIFESPTREVFARRFEIVQALHLKPGVDIADIGAGTGLYTLLFARAVRPDGKVYAVDISESFISAIAARTAEFGVDNVVPVVNEQKSTNLAPESIDLAFLADTYHHFEYPQSMLASIHLALRENGALAIIDFRRRPNSSSAWVMNHVRAGREKVIKAVEAAGFKLESEPLKLKTNYFLLFRKLRT